MNHKTTLRSVLQYQILAQRFAFSGGKYLNTSRVACNKIAGQIIFIIPKTYLSRNIHESTQNGLLNRSADINKKKNRGRYRTSDGYPNHLDIYLITNADGQCFQNKLYSRLQAE